MASDFNRRDKPMHGAEHELVFLCGAFLLGAVFGSFFASGFSPQGPLSELISYTGDLKNFLFLHGTILVIIFTAPFYPGGQMAAPCGLAAEGFLLAMLVTSTIQNHGFKGYFPAIIAWFLTGMVNLLLFLFIGCKARMMTIARKGRGLRKGFGQQKQLGQYFLCGMAVFVILVIAGCLHCYGSNRWAVWLMEKLCM